VPELLDVLPIPVEPVPLVVTLAPLVVTLPPLVPLVPVATLVAAPVVVAGPNVPEVLVVLVASLDAVEFCSYLLAQPPSMSPSVLTTTSERPGVIALLLVGRFRMPNEPVRATNRRRL
jgi:hypothetical protein